MELVFYCGDCKKFFYSDTEAKQLSTVCTHCGSETTITCNTTKEQYLALSNDRKEQWKADMRKAYPNKGAIDAYRSSLISKQRFENIVGALFTIKGSRGRTITVCKTKCIIKTDVTVGSVMTHNAADGEKIIFFKHCAGLQFKESGFTIGYLQFETPSMQMNNQNSNFFSENTFTFEEKNGLTNEIMRNVFYYVLELIENCASGADFDIPEYPYLLQEYINSN